MQSQKFVVVDINARLERLSGGFELISALSANRAIRLGKLVLFFCNEIINFS